MPDLSDYSQQTPDMPVMATPTMDPRQIEALRRAREMGHTMDIYNGPILTRAQFAPGDLKTTKRYYIGDKEISDPYRSSQEIMSGLTPDTLPKTSALDLDKISPALLAKLEAAGKLGTEQTKANASEMNTPEKLYDAGVAQSYRDFPNMDEKTRQAGFTKQRQTMGIREFRNRGATAASPPVPPATPSAPTVGEELSEFAKSTARDPKTGQPLTEPIPGGKGEREISTQKTPGETLEALHSKYGDQYLINNLPEIKDQLLKTYGETTMNKWFQQSYTPWGRLSPDQSGHSKLMAAINARGIDVPWRTTVFGGLPTAPYFRQSIERTGFRPSGSPVAASPELRAALFGGAK